MVRSLTSYAMMAVVVLAVVGRESIAEEPEPVAGRVGAVEKVVPAKPSLGGKAISPKYLAMAQGDLAAATKFLLKKQREDGGWGQPVSHPAITGLVLKALVRQPAYNVDTPAVANGFRFMLKHVQPDGGIYHKEMGLANYTTSTAVMALVAAKNPKFKPYIVNATKYLRGIQIVEGTVTPDGDKITKDHPFFGGTSYGKHGRPDLSNLSFTVAAMHEAGLPKDDPFFSNATVFLSRMQSKAETNDQPWAAVANDGGYAYAIGKDLKPESKAGVVESNGARGPRSYGSMTYAGFMAMLYSNVSKDDPRVRGAYGWIRKYWRLDSNPNMPQAQSQEGLFYYYQVFAKALRAWGQDEITDSRGDKHNWREELIEIMHEKRGEDGSWVNLKDRWHEGMPELVTAYVALALEECLAK